MRKFYLKTLFLACTMLMSVSSAWADVIETVGATDCSSNFNDPKSSIDFNITGNGGRHITFVNHNSGSGDVWNNWLLCINDGGSTEYMFLRADNYGWDANLYNNYVYGAGLDWNTFVADLNGATVSMYIYRKGTNIFVRNTITTSGSEPKTYFYDACASNVTGETIHPYLSVDHSWLEITGNEAIAEDNMPTLPDYPAIGNSTTQVWTEAKQPITMSKGNAYYFKFTNTMIGTNKWENYKFRGVQVVDKTDVERFIIRADNYDDINKGDATFTSNFDWGNFKDDLNGATVEAVFAYNSDGTVFFRTEVTPSTAGRNTMRYEQYTYANTIFSDADIKLFPAVNGAYIEMMSQTAAYKMQVSANNNSYGSAAITSSTIGGYVGSGTSVTVTATPNEGYYFVNWTEGGEEVSTEATYIFTANSDHTLVAHFAKKVSTATTWDWSKPTTTIELSGETTPKNTASNICAADFNGTIYDAITWGDFDPSALVMSSVLRPVNNDGDYYQGTYLKFITTVPGTIEVEFSNTGGGERPYRYLYINGEETAYKSNSTTKVPTNAIPVQAGEIELKGVIKAGETGAGDNYLRIYKIVFTPVTSVSKTITSAGWATYCSPYALDFTSDITNLTDAYLVTGESGTGEYGTYLTLTSVNGGTVPANTGLLLKGEGECVIPVVASSSTDVTANKLVGVTTETVVSAGIYVLLSGDNGIGFYRATNDFTVGANSAYLPADAFSAKAIFYNFNDDTTGLETISNSENELSGEFFDLSGRKVAKPTKGLYIMNGKKVFIK